MGRALRASVAAAALLFAISSCASVPTSVQISDQGHSTPCHHPYVADIDTRVAGQASPVDAAVAWATTQPTYAPAGAPRDGWEATKDGYVRSGDWFVGVTATESGGWTVSGLGCSLPQD